MLMRDALCFKKVHARDGYKTKPRHCSSSVSMLVLRRQPPGLDLHLGHLVALGLFQDRLVNVRGDVVDEEVEFPAVCSHP